MKSPALAVGGQFNQIRGGDTDGLGYFLGCLFHFFALITIVEYIQCGTTSYRSQSIVQCTFQAESVFSLLHDQGWLFRRTSLFTALAVLLNSAFCDNQEG